MKKYTVGKWTIEHQDQECEGNYKFDGGSYMTRGFAETFGGNVIASVLASSLVQIVREYTKNADYLQVFNITDNKEHETYKIFMIDDKTHFTLMLAEEY